MSDRPVFSGEESVAQIEREPLERWLQGSTVPDIVLNIGEARGAALAHRFLATADSAPVDQSFADIAKRMQRYAAAFASISEKPVVASLLPALPEALPLGYAAMWAGVYLPINPFLEPDAIIGMLQSTGARVLLAEGSSGKQGVPEKLGAIAAALPDLEIVVCGEAEGEGRLEEWLEGRATTPPPMPEPSDIAAYFHTGGTTGLPKIARLTHANLAFMAFLAGWGGDMRVGDAIPCGMPLFHVGGLIFGGLAPFAAGACVVQLGRAGYRDRAMTEALWEIARREGADILFGPPTVAIAAIDLFEPPAPPNVRHWVSSAAPLPAATHRRFTDMTGIAVKEAWGLTEASLVLTFMPALGESRPGSVGVRLPYCKLGIVSLTPGAGQAKAGEAGVIMGRSPGLFAGYLGRETDGLETAPALGDGRWLNTGDVGYFDGDGYLFITGRAKDMILRGGHNIDPATIEEAFGALDDVSAVAAVGRPDRRVGELPVCYVTAAPGKTIDPSDLLDRAVTTIAERAAHPKTVYVLAAMPLTAVGKIDKVALRRDAAVRAVREEFPAVDIVSARSDSSGRILVSLSPLPENASEVLSSLGLVLAEDKDQADD